MKKKSRIYAVLVAIGIFGVVVGGMAMRFIFASSEPTWSMPVTLGDPLIMKDPLLPDQWTYLESQIKERADMQKTPYNITKNTSNRRTDITINLPAFIDQPEDQKRIFFDRVRHEPTYALQINITDNRTLVRTELQQIFAVFKNMKKLTFSFVSYPSNYSEIFDAAKWIASPEMELAVYVSGPIFPYGFHGDAFIMRAKKMTKTNNKDIKLKSFVFGLDSNESSQYILAIWEKELKYFPTKSLSVSGALIRPFPDRDDERQGREKVEAFFKESPIEAIDIGLVGIKENGKIRLLGF